MPERKLDALNFVVSPVAWVVLNRREGDSSKVNPGPEIVKGQNNSGNSIVLDWVGQVSVPQDYETWV
jgi:hypothetical protein